MATNAAHRYDQPIKCEVRQRALEHAVQVLTERRANAAVVARDHVERVKQIVDADVRWAESVNKIWSNAASDEWKRFWDAKNGRKCPNDLVVAYLAGPQPLNDFNVLVGLGVHPYNIYAFESNIESHAAGLDSIRADKNLHLLKVIKVSFEEFLKSVPQQFDIIYFDACGPLPSVGQKTMSTLSAIFQYQRLNPLSVLITNFSKPEMRNGKNNPAHASLVGKYLYTKDYMEAKADANGEIKGSTIDNLEDWNLAEGPFTEKYDEDSFIAVVEAEFDDYYGQYLTRQIYDMASFISPLLRFACSPMWRLLFSDSFENIASTFEAHHCPSTKRKPHGLTEELSTYSGPSMQLATENCSVFVDPQPAPAPERPTMHSTFAPYNDDIAREDNDYDNIVYENFNGGDGIRWDICFDDYNNSCGTALDSILGELKDPKITSFKSKLFSTWRDEISHTMHTGDGTCNLQKAMKVYSNVRDDATFLSTELKTVLQYSKDNDVIPFCDVWNSESMLYSMISLYAHPYHYNTEETKRFTYTAKSTAMFLDVIVFDTCRYVYDWLPAVELVKDSLDAQQHHLIYEFALDGLKNHSRYYNKEYFFGQTGIGNTPGKVLKRREFLVHSESA